MHRRVVAITDWSFPDLELERHRIESNGFQLSAVRCSTESELIELCREADAVITQFARISSPVVTAMQRATVIVRYGIGVDNVDLEAARQCCIPVCNVPDYCIDEVADQTLAFLLAMTRQVLPNALHVRAGNWGLACPLTHMNALKYLTIGVVGFGRIGREVVRRLTAFKCRVLVVDPVADQEHVHNLGATLVNSLDECLPHCDVLTLHVPSTNSTRRMIDRTSLAQLKPGAALINVSRGDLVESQALIDALATGRLSAAALDVFDPEPIPIDSPLRHMNNVILASHIASASPTAVQTLRTTAVDIALQGLRGEKLLTAVNGVHVPRLG